MKRLLVIACSFICISMISAQEAKKRPLTHADYDIWNSITGMTLSPDGKFVAYSIGAPKGDSQFVVQNVATGQKYTFAKAGTPAAGAQTESKDEGEDALDEDQFPTVPTPGGIQGIPTFTPDSRFLYFVLIPMKAETDKAIAEKKETPKPALAVLDLATGKILDRITGIRSFSVVGEGAGILITVKNPPPEPKTETAPMPKTKDETDQQPKVEPKPTDPPATPRFGTGYEVVIKNLTDGKSVSYADVQEYLLTKDFKQMAYTVIAKKLETNGVYFADLWTPVSAKVLVKGVGRYYRLVWDEKQTQLAFFFDDTPLPALANPNATTTPPIGIGKKKGLAPTTPTVTPVANSKPRVYHWNRNDAAATLVLGPEATGLKKGWQVVDRGGLSFSADGLKLNVGTAPEPEKPATTEPKKTTPATTQKVELDLWHWKDQEIQPMQKVRSGIARSRSFSATYLIDAKRLVHLSNEDVNVTSPAHGDWALGSSDKKYRGLTWDYPSASDYALVNIRTGETKPIVTGARSFLSTSPKGKYIAGFDGKNWYSISVPDGKKTILTAKLPTKFFNEDDDHPAIAPAYGIVNWSNDEKYIYVRDRHDIWRVAADGSEYSNVTQIGKANDIRFSLIRVEKPDDADTTDRGLDAKFPWLLSAENLTTRDTGIYRLEPGQKPKLLIMGSRNYGPPVKAKKADTMILQVSTLTDYPDYYTTTDFKELKRLTDANPHKKDFNWATAELVHYTTTDGAKLSGVLVKPENFDPNKKYPMIVYIYERLSNNLHGYRVPNVTRGQVINPIWYASNGYLVLMPDIAYKIGYPGASSLNCVIPAIQAVVDKGCVNEKAIGINGQSWGGYQIAYMITQTNRFKAAAAGAAVSNMVSAYNGIRWGSGMPRQFQYEKTQSRIGETLWQAPMKYIENSPVFMSDRVQTPLLMIHNDQDDAVPWYQGIEYYLALRRLGKEVYMLNYNGEPHNLAKQINARDFALRMHQFYEHHLKGAAMPEWMAKGVPYNDRDKEKEQWKKLFEK